MSIIFEEEKLFDELKRSNPNIIMDGIVNEKEYLSAKYRIVYILKEANGGKGWSLKDFLYSGGRAQTWDNVSRWTEAILNLENNHIWSYWEKDCEKRRSVYLKKIGVINLKKEAGSHTSVGKEIHSSAIKNKDFLQKQLSIYQPNLIICCGTAHSFIEAVFPNKHIDWKMTSRGIWYFIEKQKIVISFLHPEARVKDCVLHYALVDAVKEILDKNIRHNRR
ncbi:MAG: uracil-DNA glycosylase family protein [Ruminococcus sp.]|nr:uracil-DNA glycosylase family protein [Ruminococcus sp.]